MVKAVSSLYWSPYDCVICIKIQEIALFLKLKYIYFFSLRNGYLYLRKSHLEIKGRSDG